MSGYTAAALGQQGVLDANATLLGKPFTMVGLLGKVRELLDRENEGELTAGSA